METQSNDTNPAGRIEAARQIALGTLSRAKETLQTAATTVPVWAREVETQAEVRVDALLERVGLVRIAKVEQLRTKTDAPAVASVPMIEPEIVQAPVETQADAPEAKHDEPSEAEIAAEESAEASETATDRPARRRRR